MVQYANIVVRPESFGATVMPRILHITDTHLLSRPEGVASGWCTQASLDAVLKHITENEKDYAAVLVTGDLVHDESRAGYERLARRLTGLEVPVCVLPGNHDDPERLRRCMQSAGIHAVTPLVLGNWRVIPLDSHVSGEVGGKLGADQLRALQTTLDECVEDVLLAVHHPPVPVGSPWMDRMGLADGDELLRLGSRFPCVRGIVFGHVHQVFEAEHRAIKLYATPSTCRQFRPGSGEYAEDTAAPGYRCIHLEPDGGLSTRVRRVAEARSRGRQIQP